MEHQTPEFSRAASRLTCSDIFFTTLLYTLKVEARTDLPAAAATDGVHLYYHPTRFAKEFTDAERVFVLVHELLHVILFHSLRRGIRDPERWNIACDHVVNLLCVEYKFTRTADCFCDSKYTGMTAEQVYDLLQEEEKSGGKSGKPGKAGDGLSGDVMDYDPSQNEGKSKAQVEREIAISAESALQAAKAAGSVPSGMKRMLGVSQVDREPWYQHLRRYLTSMHARQYNWSRIDSRRAVLHGVISPSQKSEQMGKLVFGIDCSGSITDKQLGAMGAHISDLLKDVTPSSVVVVYFDSTPCHVDEFTGPDYHVTLEPHGGGGTSFGPVFEYVQEHQADATLVIMFTDLFGSFGEGNSVCDTLWVSQTESVDVPFGELIYGDLNED
jgi:predicted metal-dependent peptidase